MSDNDPGNSGGSVVVPSSPVPRTRNRFECDTCGAKFDSQGMLETHRDAHLSLQPMLSSNGLEVPRRYMMSSAEALASLSVQSAGRIEVGGTICDEGRFHEQLRRRNGLPEFDVTLVGRSEDVRSTYRVTVVIFDDDRLAAVEKAFLTTCNVSECTTSHLTTFAQAWSGTPERAYADALAAFRLATLMRDEPDRTGPVATVDYRKHLTDARHGLRGILRPLARTVLTVCAFIDNDFSDPGARLSDPRVEDGLNCFRHVVEGAPLSWSSRGRAQFRVVADRHTDELLEVVNLLRRGDGAGADQRLRALEASLHDGRDPLCVKKVAALWWYRTGDRAHLDMLRGDPVFSGIFERDK